MASSVIVAPRPHFVARRRTTSQSIPNATSTDVVFNEEVLDSHGQYNPSSGVFTCTISGVYLFCASVRLAATSSNMNLALLQLVRSGLVIRGQEFSGINAPIAAIAQSYISFVNVNDTLKVQVLANTVGSHSTLIDIVDNSFELAHFSGFKLD